MNDEQKLFEKLDNEFIPEYGLTRKQLRSYFDMVCNKKDWKDPINSTCKKEHIENVRSAIIFFTGSSPTFTHIRDDMYKVEAKGYYLTIGA
jgi:hypothetical protein